MISSNNAFTVRFSVTFENVVFQPINLYPSRVTSVGAMAALPYGTICSSIIVVPFMNVTLYLTFVES